ncbi:Na+/H+ antiporter NhaA [Teredinibacter purpureus]|uniref:Na+/H+ antiporter NhaA n=1 Tax=Teredinibacter purpureus TaxID=2731756 RepID=UPI0005F7724B|nr:Na+/H+ antiporter NhaA [Teredinibacter purpureus]
MKTTKWTDVFKHDAAGGVILIMAAVLAIVMANTPLGGIYDLLLDTPIVVAIGTLEIAKPLLLWVNDGLMAVFFLMVGLELKREFIEGELSDFHNIILPAVAAFGGMVVPAGIYAYINWNDPVALQGWAIPAATDIAFALGILSLLGSRVPLAIKIFLTSVAIFDDVGAIIIIALFYTQDISFMALGFAGACCVILGFLNWRGVTSLRVYMIIGVIMWVALLKSSVHATLAGVLLAFFIPMRASTTSQSASAARPTIHSPLKFLEHELHSPVAFFVLPVFAFANAGVNFMNMSSDTIFHTVPVGIAAGLFVGKQIGVFLFGCAAIQLGLCRLPKNMNYMGLYGVSLLCGIGFTMSLFVGSLAFPGADTLLLFDERLGVIAGSLLSAVGGYWVLRWSLKESS